MIRTSLIFAPETSPQVRKLAQSIDAFDLLTAYRQGAQAFNTNDIVLLVVIRGDEMSDFQSWPRTEYVKKSMNPAAQRLHPVARESAHRKMKMPVDAPAFWLVFELHEDETVLACAIGTYKYEAAKSDGGDLSELS